MQTLMNGGNVDLRELHEKLKAVERAIDALYDYKQTGNALAVDAIQNLNLIFGKIVADKLSLFK